MFSLEETANSISLMKKPVQYTMILGTSVMNLVLTCKHGDILHVTRHSHIMKGTYF
jgi:hypothetical protein